MDLTASILLVLIGITIGFLFFSLFSAIRKTPEEHAAEPEPPPSAYSEEAVHLWREARSQKLLVQAGGRVIHSVGELNESERERLAGYAADLRIWLGKSQELQAADPNPLRVFSRVLQPGSKAQAEPGPESIVVQIDALLQVRLEQTNLALRGIRLVETPGQGITVQVGLESYSSIEAVPDPEVQAAIRGAVADWEAGLGN